MPTDLWVRKRADHLDEPCLHEPDCRFVLNARRDHRPVRRAARKRSPGVTDAESVTLGSRPTPAGRPPSGTTGTFDRGARGSRSS